MTQQIKTAFEQTRRAYGSPRIYTELREDGGFVQRENRIARLMRKAGIRVETVRRFRATMDSNHALPVAGSIIWDGSSQHKRRTRNGQATSRIFGRGKDGCILRSCWTCLAAGSCGGVYRPACIKSWFWKRAWYGGFGAAALKQVYCTIVIAEVSTRVWRFKSG